MKKIINAIKSVVAGNKMRSNTIVEDVVSRLATTSIEWIG